MVYLAIKDLSTSAEDVIMVTSSILKDMQSNQDAVYRPNAIRALCKIIDVRPMTVPNSLLFTFSQPAMVQSVERYFKAYIVDKNPSIASAALVSAYHLYPKAENVAKRWVNEALEALSPKSSSSFFAGAQSSNLGGASSYLGFGSSAPGTPTIVSIPSTSYISQYHALGFLYGIRQSDRMAVTKMIQQLGGGKSGAGTSLKNPLALCMLIRYASKIIHEDPKYALVSLFLISLSFQIASKSQCSTSSKAGCATRATWSTTRPPAPFARCEG